MDTKALPKYLVAQYKQHKETRYNQSLFLTENSAGPVVRYYMPKADHVGFEMPGKIKRREAFCWLMQEQEPIAHFQISEFHLTRGFHLPDGAFLTNRFVDTMNQEDMWEVELSAVILEQFSSLWWLKKFLAITPVWVAPQFRPHRLWADGMKALIHKEFADHQFLLINLFHRQESAASGTVSLWSDDLKSVMRLFQSKMGVEPCLGPLADYGWLWRPGPAYVAGKYQDGTEADAVMESVRTQSNGDIIAVAYAGETRRLDAHCKRMTGLGLQIVTSTGLPISKPAGVKGDSPEG